MASEKKPSIYYDRGTIGSSDELDEYGVWVKSEPQDLSSANSENRELVLDGGDFDTEDAAALPDFDMDLETGASSGDSSDDSQESFEDDISFDADALALAPAADSGDDAVDSAADSGDIAFDSLTDSDDLTFDSVADSGDIAFDPAADSTEEPAAEDLELPDIDLPVDEADMVSEDFSGEPPGEAGEEAEEGFEEIPLDELTGEEEEAPISAVSSGPPIPEPEGDAAPKAGGTDLSTQLLMKIANELSSIKNELSTLKQELAGFKAGEKAAGGEEEDGQGRGFFGEEDDEKIALTGDELDNILNTADFTEETGADATEELEDGFLPPEAEDDSSSGPFPELTEPPAETGEEPGLLSEQDDIIGEFPEIPGEEEPVLEETAEEPAEIPVEEPGGPDPFAEAAEIPAAEELELEEESLIDLPGDLDSFDETPVPAEEPADLDIDINLKGSEEELPDFSVEDSGLQQVLEDGAVPMTSAPAPEDTGFLEEDPLAVSVPESSPEPEFSPEELDISFEEDFSADEPDLPDLSPEEPDLSFEEDIPAGGPDPSPEAEDTLDLTGAVIDEPDLSEEIKENPLQEPSLDDISIDLDLEDDFAEIGGIEDSGDAVFVDEIGEEEDIEISAGSFEAVPEAAEDLTLIPEGFVVESEDAETSAVTEPEGEDDPGLGETEFEESAADEEAVEEVPEGESTAIPSHLKQELKTVLSYMDHLLESLPDDKIEEFARSEYFNTYKKLFKELGLV
ncbi:MAG: hypothetical protein LBL43_02765 [Treponema sp.]|nr:hypothetical protein [Treponema sp.]